MTPSHFLSSGRSLLADLLEILTDVRDVLQVIWEFPKIRGLFGGPPIKDCSILGMYIGVPLFWETTICVRTQFGVKGLRFKGSGLGFRVQGQEFRVKGRPRPPKCPNTPT